MLAGLTSERIRKQSNFPLKTAKVHRRDCEQAVFHDHWAPVHHGWLRIRRIAAKLFEVTQLNGTRSIDERDSRPRLRSLHCYGNLKRLGKYTANGRTDPSSRLAKK